MSRRYSNDSAKSSSSGMARRGSKLNKVDAKGDNNNNSEFNWDKYLQQQNGMSPAPSECFKQQVFDESKPNKFKVLDKVEAKDARNISAICVATIVSIQGPRLCLRLDGTDGCNDFWRLIDSKDIFPIGTCEAHGGLLQPPLGFTRNVSTWPAFLQRTLKNSKNRHASADCFYLEPEGPQCNLFEIGMKLEAVDKKNPQLICPATIGDVDGDQVYISFDGWRGAFDYWCNYDSRELFPVGWCQKYNHPMQAPGLKGDNPSVCEKLKAVAQESKRLTRSVKNILEQKPPVKEAPVPTQPKEKPVRRRRVDSIKAPTPEKKEEDTKKGMDVDLPNLVPSATTSDGSGSSDDSESSHEGSAEKRPKLNVEDAASEESNSANQPSTSISNTTSLPQKSDEELMKLQRKVRKQKRKQRKLAKALKRAGIAQGQIGEIKEDSIEVSLNLTPEQVALLTSPRKRASVMETDYVKSKMKKKKKRRSLTETSYTRMEGFGLKNNEPPTTVSTKSPTSPSFLDALTAPPPSLFGGDKPQIVRDATQGWPARLQMGSVVTSDNKLGRFDKTVPEKPQEVVEPPAQKETPVRSCSHTQPEAFPSQSSNSGEPEVDVLQSSQSSLTEASISQCSESEKATSRITHSQTTASWVSQSETITPQLNQSKTTSPLFSQSETSTSQSGQPETSTSQSGQSEASTSQSGQSETSMSHSSQSETSTSHSSLSETATSQSSQPETSMLQYSQPETSTSQCVSTTTNESRAQSSKAPEENTERTTPSPFVTSTTTTTEEKQQVNNDDHNNVSSTTNPLSVSNVDTANSSTTSSPTVSQPTMTKVTSTVVNTSSSEEKKRSRNPLKWVIADVINYVREKEPALVPHLALFQKHQIDGKALLLLNSNNIVKYMELKLGPALKLCSLVEKLKVFVQTRSRRTSRK